MADRQTAFIFPAFTSDYINHPGKELPGFTSLFNEYLNKATRSLGPELAGFDPDASRVTLNELTSQFITFIYSCAASSVLRKAGLAPCMNAGYSMGIYAALVDSGAITFHSGLELIRIACDSMSETAADGNYGMGTIIGLDRSDVEKLIVEACLQIEITNQNASHAFVVSGYYDEIQTLMRSAREEGALHVRDLPVTVPYHSGRLKDAALLFNREINHLEINTPRVPIISMVDQAVLSSPESVRLEITRNLYQPLNWLKTMRAMLDKKITRFIECGPSKGLTKNARFVDGEYRFHALNSFPGAE